MAIESLMMHETRKLRARPGSGEEGWAAYDSLIRDALLRLQSAGYQVFYVGSGPNSGRFGQKSGNSNFIFAVEGEATKLRPIRFTWPALWRAR